MNHSSHPTPHSSLLTSHSSLPTSHSSPLPTVPDGFPVWSPTSPSLSTHHSSLITNTAEAILQHIGGTLDASTMPLLTSDQITLLAYYDLRTEVLEGGFIQLIHNGYGPFIFLNPFAKAMRLWGKELGKEAGGSILHDFSKLIYDGRRLFELHAEALTADMDDDAFMALYEQYPDFDELDDAFIDMEEDITAAVARYIENHQEAFHQKL